MVEVMSSIGIMAFISVVYIQFSVTSGLNSGHAVRSSVATGIVQSVAEDLSMVPTSNTWLMTQSELPLGAPYPFKRLFTRDSKETADVTQAYYTVSWTVTANTPIIGAKSVAMNVRWMEGSLSRQLGMRVIR